MNVEHAIEGLRIGVAELEGEPTGCTVLAFDAGVLARSFCDVRGGAPAVFGESHSFVNAIVFAGGSLMGLSAIAGVADAMHEARGRGIDWLDFPCVVGACVFDYVDGRTWRYPDPALGAAAWRAAQPGVAPIGRIGAGRSATAGKMGPTKEPSGQGAAAWSSDDGTAVLVLTVVNAVGSIIDRTGAAVIGPDPRTRLDELEAPPRSGNTTITAVVTNARMGSRELRNLGRQVHASMARAIQPFHTATDGDVLWAISTGTSAAPASPDLLAWRASEVAWDAVLSVATPTD